MLEMQPVSVCGPLGRKCARGIDTTRPKYLHDQNDECLCERVNYDWGYGTLSYLN
jgi:hypothetical protein